MSSARATKIFDKLSNSVGVSDAGKAWLIAAIDPFHDEPIQGLRGLPDGNQSESVVQIVRKTITIKCPSTVTEGTWDCHIQSLPIAQPSGAGAVTYYNPAPTYPSTNPLSIISDFDTVSEPVGPLNFTSGPSGAANTSPSIGVFSQDDTLQRQMLFPDDNYITGIYRIISSGWEVISAGPQLYQSGVVYTYAVPAPDSQITQDVLVATFGSDVTKVSTCNMSTRWFPNIPSGISAVNLIPNCQSWNAKEGVYVVDKMSDIDQATFGGSGISLVYPLGQTGGGTMTGVVSYAPNHANMVGQAKMDSVKFGDGPGTATAIDVNVFPGVGYTAYDHSGAYFTGLSLQDVLVCNAIWYIERLPGSENKDLQVLAKPCPPLDNQALEMYSIIMSEMPKAMVQKANGFGDWFKDAASLVVENVAPALAALPGPLGAVGKGVTVAGGLVKALMPKEREVQYSPSGYSENPRAVARNEIRQEVQSELKNSKAKKKQKGLLNQVSPLGKKKLKKLIRKDVKKDMRKL